MLLVLRKWKRSRDLIITFLMCLVSNMDAEKVSKFASNKDEISLPP